MRILNLTLRQYRNFTTAAEVMFPQDPLLIAVAPNASGKTNLLEAIVMLLRGKSFRASAEQCVSWGMDTFVVQGNVIRSGEEHTLLVQYNGTSKRIRIEEDGIMVSPVTFYSQYPFVLFTPEDTFLLQRGPAQRRNFLNSTLTVLPAYLSSIVQYQRVLQQRNAALKQASSPDDIQAWTDILAEYAGTIWAQRENFTAYLASHAPEIYSVLFGDDLDVQVSFVPGTPDVAVYKETLQKAWEYEKRYRYTLYGPHRDDFTVLVDGREAQAVLSRGQLRGFTIAMKLAAFGFMKGITNDMPMILFDEVLSELDADRQAKLLEYIPSETQVLITTTSIPKEFYNKQGVSVLDIREILGKEEPANIRTTVPVESVPVRERSVTLA